MDLADAETGVFPTRSRGDIATRYGRARRHSRHVRWLRVGVLAGIAIVLFALVAANYMPPVGGFRLPGEIGKLVIHGTKITMLDPRLSGYTTDSRPYEFIADSAAQDITKPDLVELQQIRAKMKMGDGSTVTMTADAGVYDMKAEKLTLTKNIHLVSSGGYESRLSQALVDTKTGNVLSDEPVWVKLQDGFLNAKHLEILENGDVLRFGQVSMVLQPSKEGSKAGEP